MEESDKIVSISNEEKIMPCDVIKYYQAKLLGKPFNEGIDKNHRVIRGYEFEGIKYYEK